MAKTLLSRGVSAAKRERLEQLPVHYAAIRHNIAERFEVDTFKLLANIGVVALDSRNTYGATVLHLAAASGNLSVVQYICNNGRMMKLLISLRDYRGSIAVDYAVAGLHPEIVSELPDFETLMQLSETINSTRSAGEEQTSDGGQASRVRPARTIFCLLDQSGNHVDEQDILLTLNELLKYQKVDLSSRTWGGREQSVLEAAARFPRVFNRLLEDDRVEFPSTLQGAKLLAKKLFDKENWSAMNKLLIHSDELMVKPDVVEEVARSIEQSVDSGQSNKTDDQLQHEDSASAEHPIDQLLTLDRLLVEPMTESDFSSSRTREGKSFLHQLAETSGAAGCLLTAIDRAGEVALSRRDSAGRSVLTISIENQGHDVVKELLNCSRIEFTEDLRGTYYPLLVTLYDRDELAPVRRTVLSAFVNAGVSLRDETDQFGATALHRLCRNQQFALIKRIEDESGPFEASDWLQQDAAGRSAVDYLRPEYTQEITSIPKNTNPVLWPESMDWDSEFDWNPSEISLVRIIAEIEPDQAKRIDQWCGQNNPASHSYGTMLAEATWLPFYAKSVQLLRYGLPAGMDRNPLYVLFRDSIHFEKPLAVILDGTSLPIHRMNGERSEMRYSGDRATDRTFAEESEEWDSNSPNTRRDDEVDQEDREFVKLTIPSPLRINADSVHTYLRFFCFFLRGNDGPFLICESVRQQYLGEDATESDLEKLRIHTRPTWSISKSIKSDDAPSDEQKRRNEPEGLEDELMPFGTSRTQNRRSETSQLENEFFADAVIWYKNALFSAAFRIEKSGMVEMLYDRPLQALSERCVVNAPLGVERNNSEA